MNLWDVLSGVGYALDTPGALTRGVLAGRPGTRASGREMLEALGVLGPNQSGLDAGDVAGFGADMLVDPVNLLGGYGMWKGAQAASRAWKGRKAGAIADPITEAITSKSRALVPTGRVEALPETVRLYRAGSLPKEMPTPTADDALSLNPNTASTPDVIPLPGPGQARLPVANPIEEAMGVVPKAVASSTAPPKPPLTPRAATAKRFAKEYQRGEITIPEVEEAVRSDRYIGIDELVTGQKNLWKWYNKHHKGEDWEELFWDDYSEGANAAKDDVMAMFHQLIQGKTPKKRGIQ